MSIKIKLVDDWKKAYKFSSMIFLAVSGGAEALLHYIHDVPQEVAQYIDADILKWIATVSFFLVGAGRVTQVVRTNVPSDQPPK